jgi:hypothetical protein
VATGGPPSSDGRHTQRPRLAGCLAPQGRFSLQERVWETRDEPELLAWAVV